LTSIAKKKSLVTRAFDWAFTSESGEAGEVGEAGEMGSSTIGTLAYKTALHMMELRYDDLHHDLSACMFASTHVSM
jgi:hypothetical protein